ncbi:MAG: HEPN domain-containing protein [Chitinispirillaceae bacterium]|nr:HEPN domain-containing protein [Chitinispirillaceae bacterium]
MTKRVEDWMRQANKDYRHAERSMEQNDFEWACFAAQQAAEKALKALLLSLHADFWGHSLLKMLKSLPEGHSASEALLHHAVDLDKVYIPARYPDSFDAGSPMDFFSEHDARDALLSAKELISYAKNAIPR